MDRIEKKLHVSFGFLKSFLDEVPNAFEDHPMTIKNQPNVVKLFKVGDVQLVVKCYKTQRLINRILNLLFFRQSKAKRAYENALKLEELKIITPLPVGYVDVYSGILLKHSYFVSLYVRCKSVKNFLSAPSSDKTIRVKDFARFSYDLHKKGIFHDDYSLQNVLYFPTPEGYGFCLIDINRMRFRKYSRSRAMHNLRRLDLPLDVIVFLLMEYAHMDQSDAFKATGHYLFYKRCRNLLSSSKGWAKGLIGIKPDKTQNGLKLLV